MLDVFFFSIFVELSRRIQSSSKLQTRLESLRFTETETSKTYLVIKSRNSIRKPFQNDNNSMSWGSFPCRLGLTTFLIGIL